LAAGEYGINSLGLDYHWIGTESLAWPLYVSKEIRDVKLKSLCQYFGIPSEPLPHNALEGARICLQVYRALMEYYAELEAHLKTEAIGR